MTEKESKTCSKPTLWLSVGCIVIFAAVSITLTAGINADYFRKIELLNYFEPGRDFFAYHASAPAGLLSWCGAFLTQFFYYPWLGAAIFTALLVALWWLVWRAFGLPKPLFALAALVPAMILLAALMPGYVIYSHKSPGFLFTPLLGVACAMAYLWLYRSVKNAGLRAVIVALGALLYAPLGFYALLSLALGAIAEIRMRRWWLIVEAVALGVAIPFAYFYLVPNHLMRVHIFDSGLPRYCADALSLRMPFIVGGLALLLCSALAFVGEISPRRCKQALIASAAVFAATMAAVILCRYRDANFSTTVGMDVAIGEGNYARAIELARENNEHPTRAMGMLTHLALFHQGTAADSLFAFRMSDAEYNSPIPTYALRMAVSRSANYGYGRLNDCYRWCMEDMVEYGPKVDYYKYMVKCALLNGEMDLARRYLNKLSKTLFHKDWAAKYAAYIDHPELMDQDPEFSAIKPLLAYRDRLGGDSALIETFISTILANMLGGPREMVELSMQFNLIQKNIDGFWRRFFVFAHNSDHLPRHYQEAALLFSALEQQVDWRQFNISPEIAARFERFMAMAQRNSNLSEQANARLFYPEFGDTYWYYYFFVKGLKTT